MAIRNRRSSLGLFLAGWFLNTGSVRAQCLDWKAGFTPPGVTGTVEAMGAFDDGGGLALYVGGDFVAAGDIAANSIDKWDGTTWTALGEGVGGVVRTIAVFDDGTGSALYVGGTFTSAGGIPAHGIARWNGSHWSSVGGGMDQNVAALAVFDDGSGAALYAGGSFRVVDGDSPAQFIAKWTGQIWVAVGGGMRLPPGGTLGVGALKVCDFGQGPELYAAGDFIAAGGVNANRIAKWNGQRWAALGTGIGTAPIGTEWVRTLEVYDAGSGPELCAGGVFATAGGQPATDIAQWNGTNWAPLGTGVSDTSGETSTLNALTVFDVGNGPELYAVGRFTMAGGVTANCAARWNGTRWAGVGGGLYDPIYSEGRALAVFDDGSGASLYAGGRFNFAERAPSSSIAKWKGSNWAALSTGAGVDSWIHAMTVFDEGPGAELYIGGEFLAAGNLAANYVAKWNGLRWADLPGGPDGRVNALSTFDDGSGPKLYAGGDFSFIGDKVSAPQIARWDGSGWSGLGHGMNGGRVFALTAFNDGSGKQLYAGGLFNFAGDRPASNIAKWDGSSWSPVRIGTNGAVHALAVFDDGSGPALFVGGQFTSAGGAGAHNIAKWDGSAWSPLGSGTNGAVVALTTFDDGSGAALYVGGNFILAGGASANYVAKWDGSSWTAVGSELGGVEALTVFDDGSRTRLYAAAALSLPAAPQRLGIAQWNGTNWALVGNGMRGGVETLAVYDDGSGRGPDLYAGGFFDFAGREVSRNIAAWTGCGNAGSAYCLGDGSGTACPCGNNSNPGDESGCLHSLGSGGKLTADGFASATADTLTLHSQGMPDGIAIYLQGTTQDSGGLGTVFGDGLRCLSGSIIRLGAKINVNGASSYPETGDSPVHIRGAVNSGSTRNYQVLYRDSAPFCSSDGFNLTNGWSLTWH
jgi:hypothetical protein